MRTTLNIDDDLLRDLKKHARAGKTSLTALANRVLRRGLRAGAPKHPKFRQQTYAMGKPLVDLTHAQAVADALDDEDYLRKMKTTSESR